jgi:nitric oxide synthase-interacting protein
MPSRHSKQINGREVFTQSEKDKAGVGTQRVRLGTESQLPFGYCGISLQPAVEGVVSPTGRIYSREAILEYLLQKTKEIKELTREREMEQVHGDKHPVI